MGINTKLQEEFAEKLNYQYKHFFVRWDNQKSARKQGAALAAKIKNFLKNRQYKWDVVLVGHSRGAVMVDRISKYLVGNGKIDNIYSYLLDPTASGALRDVYPTSLPSKTGTTSYGTAYFDRKSMIAVTSGGTVLFDFDLGATWSDTDIFGYQNIDMLDSLHETIHMDWINAEQDGLADALATIQSNKVKALYVPDGTLGLDVIQVSSTHGLDVWGERGCEGNRCFVQGDVTLDGFTVAFIEGSIEAKGIEFSYGMQGVATAQYVFKSDQILVARTFDLEATGIPGGKYITGTVRYEINRKEIAGTVKVLGVRSSNSVNTSDIVAVDISIFGIGKIEGNLNDDIIDPYYNDVVKPVGDLIQDGGDWAGQKVKNAGDSLGDGARNIGRKLDVTTWRF